MLKKSVIICVSFGCLSVWAADSSGDAIKNISPNSECAIQNVSPKQVTVNSMDELQQEINVHAEHHQITNAQQMYDFVTKIRASEHNPNIHVLFDVMRSFLRKQENSMPFDKLMRQVKSLIEALKWMGTAQSTDNSSFYDKSSHISTLVNPDMFIHLTKEQMQFCLKLTNKMKTAMEISSISDDISAEDGVALTSVFFEKEYQDAKTIYNAIEALEKEAAVFVKDIDSISKEEITERIAQLTDFIRSLKQKTISVNGRTMQLSKNNVRYLRGVCGSVMSRLYEALLHKQ